ncbi:fimbria/pilus periplasmic chaperone [Erwinia sp. 9145]|uniref:fimbrial biogenesis chaperone n=1 Tax=Erwinia sp. 9145 TaxID=1500895 RepID=UPI00054DD5BE|nr:fimbria/pilus periplasmic chaperone [Erwinia sp. 9145]
MNIQSKVKLALSIMLFSLTAQVNATVVLNSTRAIYNESEKEVIVKVDNKGEKPSLLQSWIDTGDKDKKVSQIDVPFIISPPVVRIEPAQGQSLRITYTGNDLPDDRESVFWLNVLDIPPQAESSSSNVMQMAFRTRIKLFFRPDAIRETTFTDATDLISWRDSGRKEGAYSIIDVINSSPLHMTLSTIEVRQGEKKTESITGNMVAPFLSESYKIKTSSLKNDPHLFASYINDHGVVTLKEIKKD